MHGVSVLASCLAATWLTLSACSSNGDAGLGPGAVNSGAGSPGGGGTAPGVAAGGSANAAAGTAPSTPAAGAPASGGSSAGAPASGGSSAGAPASGGSSAGGSSNAGVSAGGASGGGGGVPGAGGSVPTMACGSATWPTGGPSAPQVLDVQDSKGATTARQFYISLPASYDGKKAYPLVFAWHYAGGTASALIASGFGGAFYGVQKGFPEAIYVAGQGLTDANSGMSGWPNTNGRDIALTRAMLTWLERNYCIDQSRIMATGMSYGGIMSDTLACQMPDVFRAIGVMSGALFNLGANKCSAHPIAAWITHGTADPTVAISGGEAARDQVLADNGCGTTTKPVDPSPCVSYDGCASGYPVVWCPVVDEGHTIPSFAAGAIAAFFKQF